MEVLSLFMKRMGRSFLVAGLAASVLNTPLVQASSTPQNLTQLSLNRYGIAQAGHTVTFQAVATGGAADYQFWVQTQKGWSMARNYSPNPRFQLALEDGSYVVAVYALSASSVHSGLWNQALVATDIVNVGSAVHLSVAATATQNQGMTVVAQARNLISPVYQFWVENPQGQWAASGGYQSSSSFTYTPPEAGTYHIIAYAKDPEAPNTNQDAVWSQTHTFTAAPKTVAADSLTTSLMNPLSVLSNPNALLLGQTAQVQAVVTGANGQPLADVPVVFTATNDSNPADHVTFPQGLNGNAVTNAQGIATTTMTVTNPNDNSSSALALDASAVTAVGYQVSVPSAPALQPVQGQVLFAALNETGTTIGSATGSVMTSQRLGTSMQTQAYAVSQNTGTPLEPMLSAQFLLPQTSTAPQTIAVNQTSGSYGADSVWHSVPIVVPQAFSSASVNISSLGLSAGSALTVTYTPQDGSTPYVRVLTGPLAANDFGVQLPAQSDGGQLTFTLTAPSTVTSVQATGVGVQSVTYYPLAQSVTSLRVPASDVTWTANPVSFTAFSPLSTSQAAADLGTQYQEGTTYQAAVPVYPEVGDGVVEALGGGAVTAAYWIPSQNNGQGQNVLVSGQSVLPVTPSEALAAPQLTWDSTGSVRARQSGIAELYGVPQIPGVAFPLPGLYTAVSFVPASQAASEPWGNALAGQTVQVTATVTDDNGNLVAAGTPVTWQISGAGVQVLTKQSETGANGTASVVLTGAGNVKAIVSAFSQGFETLVSDQAMAPSPTVMVQWLPVSLIYTPQGGQNLDVSNAFTQVPLVTLTPGSTQFGMTLLAGQMPLEGMEISITGTGTGTLNKVDVISNAQGQATFEDASSQPGSQAITLAVDSALPEAIWIDGGPDVGQGPTSAYAHLTIPVQWQTSNDAPVLKWAPTPLALAAVGQTADLTVQVLGPNGSPEANVPIAFSVSGQQTAVLTNSQATTNASGFAQVGLSSGSLGESDTVMAQMVGSSQWLISHVTWTQPPGPTTLTPVSLSLSADNLPNQLTLTFSRTLNPDSVLPNGSQFTVTDLTTNVQYQIASAQVNGSQVVLTLSGQNPELPSGDVIAVSVNTLTQAGITTAVTDNYQRPSQIGPVTLVTPSSPTVVAAVSGSSLVVTVNDGTGVSSGQSVVIVPSSDLDTVGNLAPGAVYTAVTSASTGSQTFTIPYTATDAGTFTVYFDGVDTVLTV
ncbi:MAG: hypothetical protein C7B44_08355 [Sulfobacillus thermosulfidooxidans]|nr:MAG: hypothetical protein C7B44_08355 [Sulfobacillus thermosulfidooxidans]